MVARYQDGRVLKGVTNDFLPAKDRFHVVPLESPPGSKPLEVLIADLKAVFFVRDFAGNPQHKESADFDPGKAAGGRKIRVVFKDGETMVGTTQGYQPGRPGFFVVPADAKSNNERCFVVSVATREVAFL
ncbi:MAG TPA: hypothetical protein VN461_23865 [Vicinamibacteria bacterium]|nr:hypothetical protein [Vicinamibacteria bacterium]